MVVVAVECRQVEMIWPMPVAPLEIPKLAVSGLLEPFPDARIVVARIAILRQVHVSDVEKVFLLIPLAPGFGSAPIRALSVLDRFVPRRLLAFQGQSLGFARGDRLLLSLRGKPRFLSGLLLGIQRN